MGSGLGLGLGLGLGPVGFRLGLGLVLGLRFASELGFGELECGLGFELRVAASHLGLGEEPEAIVRRARGDVRGDVVVRVGDPKGGGGLVDLVRVRARVRTRARARITARARARARAIGLGL